MKEAGGDRGLGRAQLDLDIHAFRRNIDQPVAFLQVNRIAAKRLIGADDDLVLVGFQADNEKRRIVFGMAAADAEAAALANRVIDDAVMPAKKAAVDMHD